MHAPDAVFEKSVRDITPGGGTAIASALDRAHGDLAAVSGAKKKHVLLLTDGQSPKEGLAALADAIAKDGATLSTIALGDSADEATLGDLATRGHGTFFKAKSPSALGAIFEKDIRAALR
jgi:Mg-chelatase subunit ChlD